MTQTPAPQRDGQPRAGHAAADPILADPRAVRLDITLSICVLETATSLIKAPGGRDQTTCRDLTPIPSPIAVLGYIWF
jgi:hypothetical protein